MCRSYKKGLKGKKRRFVWTAGNPCWKKSSGTNLESVAAIHILRFEMPSTGPRSKFCNWQTTQRCNFAVYADLEALLVPGHRSLGRSKSLSKTIFSQLWRSTCRLQIKQNCLRVFYRGDSINRLLDFFRSWLTVYDGENQNYYDLTKVLGTWEREQLLSSNEKRCCLCRSELQYDAVIHQNHATGEVYGLAHSKCNRKAKTVKFLPIFFNNLASYYAHHILKYLQLRPNEILSAMART